MQIKEIFKTKVDLRSYVFRIGTNDYYHKLIYLFNRGVTLVSITEKAESWNETIIKTGNSDMFTLTEDQLKELVGYKPVEIFKFEDIVKIRPVG